jgi:hypothetical protein
MRRTITVLAVAAVGIAVGAAVAPAAALAVTPTCGSTITTDVTFTSDLVCTGNALTVGAANITIDLAGHSLTGPGTGIGILDEEQGGLTVKNGSISGFSDGIIVDTLTGATLTGLTMNGGSDAIVAQGASDVHITASQFTNTLVDVRFGSPRAVVTKDHFRNSTLSFIEADNSQVTQDELTDSEFDGEESDAVTVSGTAFVRSDLDYFGDSKNWVVQYNTFKGADVAMQVAPDAKGSTITANTFADNNVGIRMSAADLDEVNGTTVSNNLFLDNGAAGLLLNSNTITGTPTVTISKNVFIHNGFNPAGRTDGLGRPVADGLHTAVQPGSQVTIAKNLTVNNANHGISADPGTVIDGGGNVSIADPAGCTGVVCS